MDGLYQADGKLCVTTAAPPAAGDNYFNGFLYNALGQLYVTIATAGTDVYIAGQRVSALGQLVVVTSAVQPVYNGGLLGESTTGASVRQADLAVPALSAFVNGVWQAPAGAGDGMYLSTAVPPVGAQQVTNPDFTSNFAGWSFFQATGVWALGATQVVSSVIGTNQIEQNLPISQLQLGSTYLCEASIRNIDMASAGPRLRVSRGAPGSFAVVLQSAVISGTSFTPVSFLITPQYRDFQINVMGISTVIGQSFEVDYIRLWLLGP